MEAGYLGMQKPIIIKLRENLLLSPGQFNSIKKLSIKNWILRSFEAQPIRKNIWWK